MKHILNSIIAFKPEGDGDGGGGSGEGDEPKPIVMSQDQFDGAVKKRLERQERKLTDAFDEKIESLNDTIAEMKKKPVEKPDDDIQQRIDDAVSGVEGKMQKLIDAEETKATEAVNALGVVKTQNETAKKQTAVVNALTKLNVVAPSDLWVILNSEGVIGLDQYGDVIPLDPRTGEPALGDGAKTMPLEDYLKEYLKTKQYYVRSSGNQGSDTKGGNADTGGDGGDNKPESLSEVFQSESFLEKEAEIIASGRNSHGGGIPEGFKN